MQKTRIISFVFRLFIFIRLELDGFTTSSTTDYIWLSLSLSTISETVVSSAYLWVGNWSRRSTSV